MCYEEFLDLMCRFLNLHKLVQDSDTQKRDNWNWFGRTGPKVYGFLEQMTVSQFSVSSWESLILLLLLLNHSNKINFSKVSKFFMLEEFVLEFYRRVFFSFWVQFELGEFFFFFIPMIPMWLDTYQFNT